MGTDGAVPCDTTKMVVWLVGYGLGRTPIGSAPVIRFGTFVSWRQSAFAASIPRKR